ncbi:MAG TPA: sulfite exporter TauE/SafE family protein, partial [Solirubrobacteraceae bacterium]|nr:sulfite exporter TauE/SafE family protein [Solirubrobacteraceae bacterium]
MRTRLALLGALCALALLPGAAYAHPLGNFSVNHLSEVSVSSDRVDVRYVLDQAEIPTFQQRGLARAELLRRIRAEVARGVRVTVDGRPAALRAVAPPRLALRPGAGGLRTTRFELALRAPARDARRVVLRDETFRDRVGWRAIVAKPGRGTAVRTSAPATDPTRRLTRYPEALLESPADLRVARLDVRPGDGTLVAGGERRSAAGGSAADGFAGLFADAAAGEGVLLLLLLAAFGWGAVHALSPGHGKAMVAAYLVGTRGTARQAVALGATVTVTHTAGVALLGVVALTLSQYVLPEDLYPWLNLAAGLLVLGVGAAVLRGRVVRKRHHHHHHDHSHAPQDTLSARGLVAMGVSAGLIPCPSALVVLLGAVAQHQIALGLLLIVAFSAGLAATLTALGLAVVW